MPKKPGPFTQQLRDTSHLRGVIKRNREVDKSTEWLRDQVVKLAHGELDLKTARTSRLANKPTDGPTNRLRLGSMYFFVYDPKTKDKLNYYDTFPLIFPFNYRDNGFIGWNLHYLPPELRVVVLDKIHEIFAARGMRDEAKYKLTYSMLNALKEFPEFQPCIKRYLSDHVRSLFRPVPPEEWQYSVLLNSQNFVKASKEKVWQDSVKMISGR